MSITVRVGVEWVDTYHQNPPGCAEPDLHFSNLVAETFYRTMGMYGHSQIFDWGNDNDWSSDFDHPDFGGDSLNWSDDVHFCYFAGHGGQFHFSGMPVMALAFASQHSPPDLAPCITMSAQWRLGIKTLKWLVLDSCVTVKDTDPAHIVDVWGAPMQGIHLIFGFVNVQGVSSVSYKQRGAFAGDICLGKPLANAWVDTSYTWEGVPPGSTPNRPIAIAAGVSRDDAINRRENETLGWRDSSIASTNWLAWKWRG